MGGKHATHDRRRFTRELLRLVLSVVALGVVIIGSALWLSSQLGSDDDVIPVEATQTHPTTSVLAKTLATVIPTATTAPVSTTTTVAPSTTTTTAPTVRDPEEVTVIVLNSTGVKGMAARLSETLADLGYLTLEADNYSPLLETSVVWFTSGFRLEAEILAGQIPDATIERFVGDEEPADITVVLGASFSE